jgi:hypothetical protein
LERDGHIVLAADHALDALALEDQSVDCRIVDDCIGPNEVPLIARPVPG